MGVTPGRVSQIERGELSTIEAIARYVQALGGRLDLVANFADHTLTVTTTDAAWDCPALTDRADDLSGYLPEFVLSG
jgi:hypothetical protein